MPARKMRVEVFDETGNRYTITFQGQVTRDKALRLLDLVELLGGIPTGNQEWESTTLGLSKFDKIRLITDKYFPIIWFSSRDIQSTYEQEFRAPIGLSTVSTYLSRMTDRGLLIRDRTSNSRRYRVLTEGSKLARARARTH